MAAMTRPGDRPRGERAAGASVGEGSVLFVVFWLMGAASQRGRAPMSRAPGVRPDGQHPSLVRLPPAARGVLPGGRTPDARALMEAWTTNWTGWPRRCGSVS